MVDRLVDKMAAWMVDWTADVRDMKMVEMPVDVLDKWLVAILAG